MKLENNVLTLCVFNPFDFNTFEDLKLILGKTVQTIAYTTSMEQSAPYLIIGAGLFTGLITLGVLVQVSNAFSRVHGGFALFLHNWTTITELRSIYKRLSEFEKNLDYFTKKIEVEK